MKTRQSHVRTLSTLRPLQRSLISLLFGLATASTCHAELVAIKVGNPRYEITGLSMGTAKFDAAPTNQAEFNRLGNDFITNQFGDEHVWALDSDGEVINGGLLPGIEHEGPYDELRTAFAGAGGIQTDALLVSEYRGTGFLQAGLMLVPVVDAS